MTLAYTHCQDVCTPGQSEAESPSCPELPIRKHRRGGPEEHSKRCYSGQLLDTGTILLGWHKHTHQHMHIYIYGLELN